MPGEVNTASFVRKRLMNHKLHRERLQHRQVAAKVWFGVGELASSASFVGFLYKLSNVLSHAILPSEGH